MKPLAMAALIATGLIVALVIMLRDEKQLTEHQANTGNASAASDAPASNKTQPLAQVRENRNVSKYAMPPELPPLPAPWESSIEFPDGSIVDVVMKPYRPDPPPFSGWSKLIHVFDALAEEAASGDAAAARVLYRSLKNCEEAFTDRASYEKAINTLHEEGVQIYPSGDVTPKMLPGSLEMQHAEEALTESFERCEGITADHHENKVQWAEIAANGGDYWAMTEMAYLNGYTPEGLYWYEQAWLHGSFLSPEQQAQAESLAARLLEENGNCCRGGWQAIAR